MSITLYALPGSPPSWRVWLGLLHLGVPFDVKRMSYAAGDMQTPEFLSINPRGQAPALVDGSLVVCDSMAILGYLEDEYSDRAQGRSLWPLDKADRAKARELTEVALNILGNRVYGLLAEQIFGLPPEERQPAIINKALSTGKRELARFGLILEGQDWLVGNAPCLADYVLYGLIGFTLHVDREQPGLKIKENVEPAVIEWMRRVERLPRFEETWPTHFVAITET